MKNIDVELYISQLVSFFENNPNDLIELIGNLQKDEFYKKLKEQSLNNLSKGEDHVLTRNQIINIVVELKIPELFSQENPKQVVEGFIEKTKWGDIILN
jgi:hypothetical protein